MDGHVRAVPRKRLTVVDRRPRHVHPGCAADGNRAAYWNALANSHHTTDPNALPNAHPDPAGGHACASDVYVYANIYANASPNPNSNP